jgi:exopolysaccharide biosynthesis predicted pyruvyltransferase EpsI
MSESKKKKVLIMMSTGKSNLGDELILREEVEFVRSHYGDAHITIATYDKKRHLIEASE